MAGVEAERASSTDTSVALLAYFQDDTRKSWTNHHDQHELEDKALALALARVADNTASLDKALQLAVSGVAEAQHALREVLEGRLNALTELGAARDATNETRIADTRRELELLTREQHGAIQEKIVAMAAQLEQHSQQRDDADRAITFARIDALEARLITAKADLERLSDTRLALLERIAQTALDAHKREHEMEQRAIEVAKDGQDTRLLSMNQFRDQLREQAATFPSRDYVDSLSKQLQDRLGLLEQHAGDTVTRAILDGRVTPLETARANQAGSERAITAMFAVLIFVVPIALHYLLPR